jgi:hypothetical protein
MFIAISIIIVLYILIFKLLERSLFGLNNAMNFLL